MDSLRYCQKEKGLELFAWCKMSNHVHLIGRAKEGIKFSNILRDFKRYTSKQIMNAVKENQHESRKEWLINQFVTKEGTRFWRSDNRPIELWSNKVIDEKLNYLHNNPVEEGLVIRPEDYVYSSAIDYAGEKGLVDVDLIDW